MFFHRLKLLLKRPDFQRNPVKALLKRFLLIFWWCVTNRPYVVPLGENLKIAIPKTKKTGSGTLIYYQGYSELDTSDFICRFLRPGMVLVDVGAHIGEYTLLGAQAVEATGQVHAFEPLPNLFPVLSENVRMNGLNNVVLNCSAVSDHVGEVEFEICDEPTLSSIRKHITPNVEAKLVKVACTSLDAYWSQERRNIDLIKVDVEGAEKFVFEGAKRLLSLPATEAPTWIFEYIPANYACFDYQPSELLELLKLYGYEVWQYCSSGQIGDFDPDSHRSGMWNLIAAKDKNYLLSQLQDVSTAKTTAHIRS